MKSPFETQIVANASYVTKDAARRIAFEEKMSVREWAGGAIAQAIEAYLAKQRKRRRPLNQKP